MRVRYGKPIKVKSIFNYNNSLVSSDVKANFTIGATRWGDNILTNANNKTYLYSIFKPDTKYYVWIKATCVQYNGTGKEEASNFANIFWFSNMFTTSQPLSSHYLKYTGDTWESSFQLQTKADPDFSEATYWYWYTNRYTDGTLNKVKFDMVIFEIDEANGLTKAYYDAHKTNFTLAADGSEVVIDDRAGQVAYENLNDNVIRCKVAGGSSGLYYGYNQLFNCIRTTNSDGTITFDDTGIYTYTFGSTISSNAYTNVIVDETVGFTPGNKYLLMRYIKAPHNGKFYCRYQNYSQQIDVTANTWITDNNIITATSGGSISSYIGPSNPSEQGYIQGDNYRVRHQIINLTDWFGAGKEPTTVAEFKEKFSKDYYGVCLAPIKLTRYQIEALPNYGYNQLTQYGDFSIATGTSWLREFGNFTISNNTLTLTNDNASHTYLDIFRRVPIVNAHKYLIGATIKTSRAIDNNGIYFNLLNTNYTGISTTYRDSGDFVTKAKETWGIITANASDSNGFVFYKVFASWTGADTIEFQKCILIDLTDWYGAGNEPTTVTEFRETFPNLYYPYSKKHLLNKYMINKLIN